MPAAAASKNGSSVTAIPRDPKVDAVDWVELIPFSETRNYVQRIMENLQVYRARFGGGTRLQIEADLHRGASVESSHQLRARDPQASRAIAAERRSRALGWIPHDMLRPAREAGHGFHEGLRRLFLLDYTATVGSPA